MHVVAVINKNAGSVKALNLEDFEDYLKQQFINNEHTIDIQTVSSESLVTCLKIGASNPNTDALIACGGDGTAAVTAKLAYKNNKIFGLLPAGTMNLFARTLGMPIDLYEAAKALANSKLVKSDLASVNGEIYIHQFSIGLQPALIKKREEGNYSSKITKALSGIGATVATLSDEDNYQLKMEIDNEVTKHEVSLLTVSNNPYGKDHLPYADRLSAHKLGIYWASSLTGIEKASLVVDILSGKWNANPDLKHISCEAIKITIQNWTNGISASLDGELIELEEKLILKSLPEALTVLVPKPPYSMNSSMKDT